MKNIILIVLLLWSGVGVWAQDKLTDEKRKEFDAQKVAFFTQELDLSPAEAAVFWPLYNEMQKKNREIEADMRKSFHEVRNAKGLKETDYKEAIGKMLGYEARLHEVKKEYYQKMIQVVLLRKYGNSVMLSENFIDSCSINSAANPALRNKPKKIE